MMLPAHDYFTTLANECNLNRICVDLYFGVHAANRSIDLTTIAPIAGITGGNIHFYQNFDVMRHGEKIYYDLFRSLTRLTVSEVEYKARCSQGLTVTEYIGGHMSSQTTSMKYAQLDADKVLSFTLRNDEKLKEDSLVYFQFAMLYTERLGERRILVLNYVWKVCKNLLGYYKSADVDSTAQFKIRQTIASTMQLGAKRTKEKLINDTIEMLFNYRKHCGQSNNPSQLMLPETLRQYPLFILSALKSPVSSLLSLNLILLMGFRHSNF